MWGTCAVIGVLGLLVIAVTWWAIASFRKERRSAIATERAAERVKQSRREDGRSVE